MPQLIPIAQDSSMALPETAKQDHPQSYADNMQQANLNQPNPLQMNPNQQQLSSSHAIQAMHLQKLRMQKQMNMQNRMNSQNQMNMQDRLSMQNQVNMQTHSVQQLQSNQYEQSSNDSERPASHPVSNFQNESGHSTYPRLSLGTGKQYFRNLFFKNSQNIFFSHGTCNDEVILLAISQPSFF